MSQPKQSASTPSVPASTVKPAQYEKGAASSSSSSSSSTAGVAAKPSTTAAAAAKTTSGTRSTTTATTPAASSVTNVGASTGAKASGGVTTTTGSSTATTPKVAAQAPPVSPAKAPPVSAGSTGAVSGAGKPSKEPPKPTETKVQVKSEVPAKASTPAPDVDPFDALAGSLPSAQPPKPSQFTGPEIKEEKKMPSVKPEKPKEVSKPLTSDEALESLSAGFVSSPPPKAEVKHETVAAAATHKNFSPAPPAQKKQEASVPASLSPAAPADKKPKLEKPAKDTAAAVAQDVKPKTEVKKVSADKPKQEPKADPMSLDALDALADTLPEDKPTPEPPQLKPEQIVDEKKQKSEKGVRVGEREDTIPPEYRFKGDKDKKPSHPSPKEPAMDSTGALDILSGDFTDATAAPAVHCVAPPKAQVKQPQVEDISALEALESDFVAPAHSKKVCSGAPPVPTPATKSPQSTSDQGDSMSLDALEALGDMLPEAKPVPESPQLRPEEIITEPNLESEKGVRVGERDDTLPPDYRFPKDGSKPQPPPPKKEPSLDTTEALDILSGGFTSSSGAPEVQSHIPPSAPPADSFDDFALEELSDDFVAPTSSSKVCSSAPAPSTTDNQADMSLEALDALGDMLPEAKPIPEPPKLKPGEVINEPKLESEKGVRVGERDDTLPPDYRFPKDDSKSQPPAPKKEPSLDTTDALDILSGGFTSSAGAPVVQSCIPPSAPPAHSSDDFDLEELADDFVAPTSASKVCSAASAPTTMDRQLSEGATSAMDALSETLEDIRPAPEPAPVTPKNIVKEKEVLEERVHKPGERDDSLPPEYRPTEADIKAAAEAKAKAGVAVKQPSIDDSKALDILSGDFDSKVPVTQSAPQCQASAAAKTSSSQKDSGPVMDKLAATLLPENFPDTKQSDSKPKKPAAVTATAAAPPPAKPSKDVVSSKKGGKS